VTFPRSAQLPCAESVLKGGGLAALPGGALAGFELARELLDEGGLTGELCPGLGERIASFCARTHAVLLRESSAQGVELALGLRELAIAACGDETADAADAISMGTRAASFS
jgi:hypothetical protein